MEPNNPTRLAYKFLEDKKQSCSFYLLPKTQVFIVLDKAWPDTCY